MKLTSFFGLIFLSTSYYILEYNRIPDAVYYQPILSENAKYLISTITFLFGLYCFKIAYNIYQRDKNKQKVKTIECSICPKCKETFNYDELEDGKCKYCEDIDTIDMEEYYKEQREKEE